MHLILWAIIYVASIPTAQLTLVQMNSRHHHLQMQTLLSPFISVSDTIMQHNMLPYVGAMEQTSNTRIPRYIRRIIQQLCGCNVT